MIVRDTDKVRLGLAAAIAHAELQRIRLLTTAPLTSGEFVRVDCENQLQRFTRRLEGTVLESSQQSDGLFLVEVELRLRLNPIEVRMLRPRKPPKTE